MINFPQMSANAMVPIRDLIELNKALQKSGRVGYQAPLGVSGESLSPLVPQSIENTLSSSTHTMEEIVLWQNIPKTKVAQTVHEFVRVEEHGLDLDPFIAEGGGGQVNRSVYEKEFVRIKYLAERREVTDVASMVGLIGPNPQAVAEETHRGTLRLLAKLERSIWHAQEFGADDIRFDGVFQQIETNAPDNVTDLRGAVMTPNLVQNVLGETYAAPRFGKPDCVYVEPRVHTSLINYGVQFGRHDQLSIERTTEGVTYGHPRITVAAPYGMVPIKGAPFLYRSYSPPTAASSVDSPADPAFAGGTPTAAPDGSSLFVAADEGDYIYVVVGVGLTGYTNPITGVAVTVASGDGVTLDITNPAGVDYYRIYRSTKDGAAATAQLMGEYGINVLGGAGTTRIVDLNTDIPGTSKALFIRHTADIFEFVRLLDFIRRPLAEVQTIKPFLLMLFGSPLVKVPTKCWVLKNIGTPELA